TYAEAAVEVEARTRLRLAACERPPRHAPARSGPRYAAAVNPQAPGADAAPMLGCRLAPVTPLPAQHELAHAVARGRLAGMLGVIGLERHLREPGWRAEAARVRLGRRLQLGHTDEAR